MNIELHVFLEQKLSIHIILDKDLKRIDDLLTVVLKHMG